MRDNLTNQNTEDLLNSIKNHDEKDTFLDTKADFNFNQLNYNDKDLDNQLKKEKLDNNIYDRKLKRRWSLIIVGVLLVFVAMQFGYSLSLLLGFDFSLLGANPLTNAQRFKLMAILMGTNFIEVIGLVIIVLKYLFSSDKTDLN